MLDLTKLPQLQTFPMQEVIEGLARAKKTVTTFYGDSHSTQHNGDADNRWVDKDQWRWYNALKHGAQVEGFNVNLNYTTGSHWWAKNHLPGWIPTDNMQHFAALQQWLVNSKIFHHTGRQLFFIQLAGQGSPIHTDFDPMKVPEHLRAPSDFIWLTPPDRPKTLTVDGVVAPWCCWFNHFKPHGSQPEIEPKWSVRIDGVFSDSFRREYLR